MISDVTVLLMQEIFMDLACTIHGHFAVSDPLKKTPHTRRTASLQKCSELHIKVIHSTGSHH